MKVVAYYTPGPYAEEANLLRASLDAVGMDHRIEQIEDAGGWKLNTWQKPFFLRRMRDEESGALLYLDVDAFVHQNCADYFDKLHRRGHDFGAHWYAGPSKRGSGDGICGCVRGGGCTKPHRLASGTLFLGDSDGCRRLLDAWCALNETWREHGILSGGGQKNLWFTVTCLEEPKIVRLKGRYCYVYHSPNSYPAAEPRIIEHTIASRLYRGDHAVGAVERQERVDELRAELGAA